MNEAPPLAMGSSNVCFCLSVWPSAAAARDQLINDNHVETRADGMPYLVDVWASNSANSDSVPTQPATNWTANERVPGLRSIGAEKS